MPPGVYGVVMVRAGGVCEVMVPGVCRGRAEQWHHRKMRSQGGEHEVVNGLGVCHACHSWIHAHPGDAYESGWLVYSWADPAASPVVYRGRRVVLDERGGFLEETPLFVPVDDIF